MKEHSADLFVVDEGIFGTVDLKMDLVFDEPPTDLGPKKVVILDTISEQDQIYRARIVGEAKPRSLDHYERLRKGFMKKRKGTMREWVNLQHLDRVIFSMVPGSESEQSAHMRLRTQLAYDMVKVYGQVHRDCYEVTEGERDLCERLFPQFRPSNNTTQYFAVRHRGAPEALGVVEERYVSLENGCGKKSMRVRQLFIEELTGDSVYAGVAVRKMFRHLGNRDVFFASSTALQKELFNVSLEGYKVPNVDLVAKTRALESMIQVKDVPCATPANGSSERYHFYRLC